MQQATRDGAMFGLTVQNPNLSLCNIGTCRYQPSRHRWERGRYTRLKSRLLDGVRSSFVCWFGKLKVGEVADTAAFAQTSSCAPVRDRWHNEHKTHGKNTTDSQKPRVATGTKPFNQTAGCPAKLRAQSQLRERRTTTERYMHVRRLISYVRQKLAENDVNSVSVSSPLIIENGLRGVMINTTTVLGHASCLVNPNAADLTAFSKLDTSSPRDSKEEQPLSTVHQTSPEESAYTKSAGPKITGDDGARCHTFFTRRRLADRLLLFFFGLFDSIVFVRLSLLDDLSLLPQQTPCQLTPLAASTIQAKRLVVTLPHHLLPVSPLTHGKL